MNKSLSLTGAHLTSGGFSRDNHEQARRTIIEALAATRTVRSRNAEGRIIYVQEPDWTIRLPAAVKICEFAGGKPVSMSLTADLTPKGDAQSQDEYHRDLMKDPVAVRSLQEILDHYAAAAEKRQPINITAAPAEKGTHEGESAG